MDVTEKIIELYNWLLNNICCDCVFYKDRDFSCNTFCELYPIIHILNDFITKEIKINGR